VLPVKDDSDDYQRLPNQIRLAADSASITSCHQYDIKTLEEKTHCGCGWHVLYGSDRLQEMNCPYRKSLWEQALKLIVSDMLNQLERLDNDSRTSAYPVIVDVSDGSMLSLFIGHEIKNHAKTSASVTTNQGKMPSKQLKVISKELKDYSRLFHRQLCSSNDLDSYLYIWDGQESWDDIFEYFDDECGEDELMPYSRHDNGKNPLSHDSQVVCCVISECFQFQLSTQPTWRAVSFLYTVMSLRQNLVGPWAKICPCKAYVMAIPLSVPELHRSHGFVGRLPWINLR
jgi:hypothetical protein